MTWQSSGESPLNAGNAASMALRWTACALYTVVIAVFSTMSSSSLSSFSLPIPGEDKIGHFGVYGLYAALLLWALRGNGEHPAGKMRRQDIGVLIFCACYGVLMEILQKELCSGDRSFEVWDIVADVVGVITFCMVVRALSRHRQSAAR